MKITFLSLENDEYNEIESKGFAIFQGDGNILMMVPSEEEENVNIYGCKRDKIDNAVESLLGSILRTLFLSRMDDVV